MGKGRKIVHKKAPEEGSVDLFATEALNVDESSSSGNEAEDDSDHEPTQAIPSKRSAVDVEDDDDATQITQDSVQKDPEPDRTASQPKTKRQRHYHIIGENHEEGVVEWYRQHELLYNKKMRAYRDRDKKAQAWATKAQALNVDGELCFKM